MLEAFSSMSAKLLKQNDPKIKAKLLKEKEKKLNLQQKQIYEQFLLLDKLNEHLDKRENEHKKNTKIAKQHKKDIKQIKKVLKTTDKLLEKLSEKDIEKFVKSKKFKDYKEVIEKHGK